jgi:hypothetical protein
MVQNLVAIVLVALAAVFIVRKLVRGARGHGEAVCDKCGEPAKRAD